MDASGLSRTIFAAMTARTTRRLSGLVVAVATAVALYRALLAERQVVDDLFIYLRYARNLASAGEIAFSRGEHVEGASSITWTLLLGAAYKVGFRGVAASKLLSLAAMLATPWMAAIAIRRATRTRDTTRVASMGATLPILLPALPAIALALDADFAIWGASGMDTSAWTLACVACVACVTPSASDAPGHARAASLALGLLPWVRPEGPLLVAFGVVALIATEPRARGSRREALALIALAAAPLVVLTLARLVYFHDVVPNTFYAKMRSVDGRDYTGLAYLASELARRPLLFLFAVLGAAVILRAARAALSPAACAAAVASGLLVGVVVFALVAQGDWMPNRRLLVPALPLAAIVVALAIDAAKIDPRRASWVVAGAAAALFVEALVTTDHALDQTWRTREWLDRRVERWWPSARVLRDPYPLDWMPTHLVHVVAPYVTSGDTLAHVDVGELPYVMSDVRIVDGFGLVDREAGRVTFFAGDATHLDAAREAFFAKDPAAVIVVIDERTGRAFSPSQDAALHDARFLQRYREVDRVPSWGDHPCITFVRIDRAAASPAESNRRIAAWLRGVPDVRPAF
jgi:hypothetical protein